MKVNELYNQVAELGFINSLDFEANNRFYYTANRALLQIAAIRPAIRSCLVNHRPLENAVTRSTAFDVTEDTVIDTEGVRAYYFEVCGEGLAFLEIYQDDEWVPVKEITLNNSGSTYISIRGFVRNEQDKFHNGGVRLRFVAGDYLYSVKNLAFYRAVYSSSPDDIPAYEEYSRYDINQLVNDFWALCAPPIEHNSNFLRLGAKYDIEDGKVILLPRSLRGIYRVLYKHKPKAISTEYEPAKNTDEIDLDDELSSLLPLLVASYLWIDEESEKAQYYLTLFKDAARTIEAKTRNVTPVTISTNGWA